MNETGYGPDDSWHQHGYVPTPTWKCRIGWHRWNLVNRHSTPNWRFYDDMQCWRCHKTRTVEVAMSDLFYKGK